MDLQHLTFFSTRGRELSHNLKLIRHDFLKRNPDISFDYYIANFSPASTQLKTKDALGDIFSFKDLGKERNLYSKTCGDLISCDLSVSKKASGFSRSQKRVLIMEPYDYIFQKLYNEQCLGKYSSSLSSDLRNFTDIIPYSPYFGQLAKEYYDIPQNIHLHSEIGIPFADSLYCEDDCIFYRKEAERIFPLIKDKKIISLITSGAEQKGNYTSFIRIDLKELFASLSKEWTIITNNIAVIAKCSELPVSMRDRVIYCTKRMFDPIKLLYFTDILISDTPYFICTFAATKKPFYIVDYCNNYFSKYAKDIYPELMLKELSNVLSTNGTAWNNWHEDFSLKYAPVVTHSSLNNLFQLYKKK